MEAKDHSTSYGVFKPVGSVVVSFPSAADADAATADLSAAGIGASDITRYSPEEMTAQVEHDLANASALSGVGQELNLVRAHGELARQGSSFLVVKASDQDLIDSVAEIAVRHHASRAQRYGRLLIEELISVGVSDKQVAESNDKGLDAQTPSSREKAE